MNWLTNNLDVEYLKKFLPHRYSFLLVDRVTKILIPDSTTPVGRSVEAFKCLTATDPVFFGHFPDQAIFPGVMQVEAMAQASSLCILPSILERPDDYERMPKFKVYLVSIDEVKFRKPAVPGDRLVLSATVLKNKKNIWQFACKTECDGQLVSEAKIMAMVEW